jgi:mRNA-degrading endonuclease RelE of RelBE toxin-antitoxin system
MVFGQNPYPPDAKKLKGDSGYSQRVGVYRILYDVDDTARMVTVYRVKHAERLIDELTSAMLPKLRLARFYQILA